MAKSSASNQPQEPSTGGRTQRIHSTPRPEALTPPTPRSMVSPTTDAAQPPETSTAESYLRIIKDIMGKFSPIGKVSEFLDHMAEEIKKDEDRPNPLPIKSELAASPIGDFTGMCEEEGKDDRDSDDEEDPEEDVMEGVEEIAQEPAEGETCSTGKGGS